MKRWKKVVLGLSTVLTLGLVVGYFTFAYSERPFVKYWRDIYIETAMSTMTKQWLATALLPSDKVQEVIDRREKILAETAEIERNKIKENFAERVTLKAEEYRGKLSELEREQLLLDYPFIDETSLPKMDTYVGLVYEKGKDEIFGEGVELKTKQGDTIYALDTINEVAIIEVKGAKYVGKLALTRPERVYLTTTSQLKKVGERVSDMAAKEGAILAVNASGFSDPNWRGNGGHPVGLVVSKGVKVNPRAGGRLAVAGFNEEHQFLVGAKVKDTEFRDAVEFTPILILDGEKKVDGSSGWGINPHTVVGQTDTGLAAFLVVDGRQPGYSIGATLEECADDMMRYGVINALQMDGGSSSVMYYKGRTITKPSVKDPNGRYMPTAWVVR